MQEIKMASETYKAAQSRITAMTVAAAGGVEESDEPVFDPSSPFGTKTHVATTMVDPTSGHHAVFRLEDLVVDFDRYLEICMDYWRLQMAADMVRAGPPLLVCTWLIRDSIALLQTNLQELYIKVAGSAYQYLSFTSFTSLITSITVGRTYSMRQMSKMFEQA